MNNNKEYINSIKNWIRTLQKSLTIESENKFNNLLGRKQYFNDYLYESLINIKSLSLSDEFTELFTQFSIRYSEYENLDITQRKRLVIDTRKSLLKLGKSIDLISSG